jgi:hypothetical protein
MLSSLPNLFQQMASLRAPERQRSEGARTGVYGGGYRRTVHLSFEIASFVFKLVCGHAFYAEEGFWQHFHEAELLRNASARV